MSHSVTVSMYTYHLVSITEKLSCMLKVTYPLNPDAAAASTPSHLHSHLPWNHTIANGRRDAVVSQQLEGPGIETHVGHESMTNTHLNEAGRIGQMHPQVPLGKSKNSRPKKLISEKGIQKQKTSKRIIPPKPIIPEVIRFNKDGIRVIDALENRGHLDDAQRDFGRVLRQGYIKIQARQLYNSYQLITYFSFCSGTAMVTRASS